MRIFKALSLLLSYPQPEWLEQIPLLVEEIEQPSCLPRELREQLLAWLAQLDDSDCLELQAQYVALFDRGRKLSLHLFEHTHAESRERGPALVELLQLYRQHGLELDARELPDYLPLLLEFCGHIWNDATQRLLQQALPIIQLLEARLQQQASPYALPMSALVVLLGHAPLLMAEQVSQEGPDEALLNLDNIWQDEAVSFMANPHTGCRPTAH